MTRRGLTLVELMIALVVFGILGTALMRLMISNSRFVSRQEALLEARQNARAAMHLLSTELRMVTDGNALRAAAPDSVTVRIPYVFGVICELNTAVIMPADSVISASAIQGGIAYRSAAGGYVFDSTVTMTMGGLAGHCTYDSIRVVPGGAYVTLSHFYLAPVGTVFYMFQRVTYKFAPSALLPGRRALWRRVGAAPPEELLAPFADSARFAFLTGTRLTVQASPPPLSLIQGLELRLIAESERPPTGQPAPTQYALMPRIKFVNRPIQ
ncbi:MAG TPA: prepilin-type N-terminal cleavage/methylation domain-containing protein [Gemmatimonadales bacterium]|nr:prepilin-type N-terminal cleavage/methylation domain-containing protein [Gemmatimonadales bacterium]